MASLIFNCDTKRAQGYEIIGLAHNTISLNLVVKAYEFEKTERLYLNSIDKYIDESFTRFLKIKQHYSDN